MTFVTLLLVASTLATMVSVSTVVADVLMKRSRPPEPKRTITVTIDDPMAGIVRTFALSARRADAIRRDIERAIRGGG